MYNIFKYFYIYLFQFVQIYYYTIYLLSIISIKTPFSINPKDVIKQKTPFTTKEKTPLFFCVIRPFPLTWDKINGGIKHIPIDDETSCDRHQCWCRTTNWKKVPSFSVEKLKYKWKDLCIIYFCDRFV